ncbi:MAG: DNA topoisomerase IB [Nocardioidaceae bacterium]
MDLPVAQRPHPGGGVDAAGRRQHIYHPQWRLQRDQLKFERVPTIAQTLPAAREMVRQHLALDKMPLERAAATAVRLLDLGYFRIGSDVYVDEHGSFGLTTLEKRHVRRRNGRLVFSFTGKSGVLRTIEIDDLEVIRAVDAMRRRRGGERLLAYRSGRGWVDMDAGRVNSYLEEVVGDELTAKDFRTWHATVIAAAALAGSPEPGNTAASRKRAVRSAVVQVSQYLGNTPTVARSAYIDPRVIDLYDDGVTIAAAVRRTYDSPAERQVALEAAVLRMLSESPESGERASRSRDRRPRVLRKAS